MGDFPRFLSQKINKNKIKLAALRLCVGLSWFKETGGFHSVRRSRVPTSILYIKANVLSICLCVHHRHLRIVAKAVAVGGRARCHGLLYIQCGCVMQFGAKQCAQQARWGCTGHAGRAKPAWAARTGPARAPHSVRRSRVPTSIIRLPFHSHALAYHKQPHGCLE